MKICKDCGEKKDFSAFYGVQNECKECTKKRVKKNSERVGNKYIFSERGVITTIYATQKGNNRNRGHGDMPYTKKELKEWLYNNGFKEYYDKWSSKGHNKDDKPSIDRVDDHKGYSLDNISLGTWKDNRKHQYNDIVKGVGTSGKRCKSVIKMDKDKNSIAIYVSYWSAARDIGYSIEYQLKKGIKCRNGFYWEYA
tara:strand:- start:51 stop:638 length:588 start_codon:yes stop_codon:yes gene_type:complete